MQLERLYKRSMLPERSIPSFGSQVLDLKGQRVPKEKEKGIPEGTKYCYIQHPKKKLRNKERVRHLFGGGKMEDVTAYLFHGPRTSIFTQRPACGGKKERKGRK